MKSYHLFALLYSGLVVLCSLVAFSSAWSPTAPVTVLRALAAYVSKSFALVFSPIQPIHPESVVEVPNLKHRKPSKLSLLRKAHKQHKWDFDDMAEDFAAHYILSTPKTDKSDLEETPAADTVTQNHDADLADYLARGVGQAMSPLNVTVPRDSKCAPPFHRQVKLSQLRSALKKNRRHFSDA